MRSGKLQMMMQLRSKERRAGLGRRSMLRECAQGRMARNTARTQTARIARAWRGRGGRGLGSYTGQGQRELRIRSAAQKGTPDHNLETLEESERRDAAGSRVK